VPPDHVFAWVITRHQCRQPLYGSRSGSFRRKSVGRAEILFFSFDAEYPGGNSGMAVRNPLTRLLKPIH